MIATKHFSRAELLERVTHIMRKDLKLGSDIDIDEATPFIGGDADIDSLDILLVLSSIERDFGIKIASQDAGEKIFQNVGTLVNYLSGQFGGNGLTASAAPSSNVETELLKRLPHAAPFRFVSRLTQVKPGVSAQGVWSIVGNEDFLKGHFPGHPIVPGVLITEALAQLSGLAAAGQNTEGRLAQIDVRFETPVAPPAEIQLQSTITRSMLGLIQFDVQASYQGKVVARGAVTLSMSNSETATGAK